MRLPLTAFALCTGLLTASVGSASIDLPSHDEIKAEMKEGKEASAPNVARYIEFTGGYNGKDSAALGGASAGLQFGSHYQYSAGIHHVQERHNASYGIDLQTYGALAPNIPALIHAGLSVGYTYHDELDRDDGAYAGVTTGLLLSPEALPHGFIVLNYTHQYGLDHNPDMGFTQLGYRFVF